MTKNSRKDIENLLRNISMSTGLSEQQLQDSVNYILGTSTTTEELKMNLWSVADIPELEELIAKCEGKHVQQVVYSTHHKGMTQVCFGCMAVNTTIPMNQLF